MKVFIAWVGTAFDNEEVWPTGHPVFVGESLDVIKRWHSDTKRHNVLWVREYGMNEHVICGDRKKIVSHVL